MASTNEIARRLISDYGLTYADFAHHAEVTERTVGRWVRDEANAPSKTIRRAMQKLGAQPTSYGLRDIGGQGPPAAMRHDATELHPALAQHDRDQFALMAARIEAMDRNILALCVKLGVETTTAREDLTVARGTVD